VAAKRDGRLELAVVFDKGSNLRVERRASITGSDRRLVRVGVNFCNSVTAAARPGTSLARVSQNKTGDRFALFLRKGCRVDADLHTHGGNSPKNDYRGLTTGAILFDNDAIVNRV
jgi:hypothetical protein